MPDVVGVRVPTRYWLRWEIVRRDEFISDRRMRGIWDSAVMSKGGWKLVRYRYKTDVENRGVTIRIART